MSTRTSSRAVSDARYAWLANPVGRVFNNLTIPDSQAGREELAQISGEALVDTAARAGGRVAIFDAKGHYYAFHDTTVAEKHPGLGDRDLIAEIIDACKRRGLTYVAYLSVDSDERAYVEHPEWRPQQADGTPLEDKSGMPRLCENTPFGAYLAEYVKELAANYEIGGMFLDGLGLYQAPEYCYCKWCREGFREAYGVEAPTAPFDDPELRLKWIAYRAVSIRNILARIRAAMHAVKPGMPVLASFSWFNWQHAQISHFAEADLIWHEPSWSWPTASIQYLRAAGEGRPVEYYCPTMQYAPSLPITLPLEEMRMRAMVAIANGGIPDFTLKGRPEIVKAVQDELAAREQWLLDTQEVPFCGLAFSHRSMHVCDSASFGEPSTFTTYGTLRALMEDGIPERYLSDAQLDNGELDGLSVIVLSNMQHVSPRAAEHLRRFVADGGGLVALHETSLYDELGRKRDDFALADLFGVHYLGELAEVTKLKPWHGDIRRGYENPNEAKMKLLKLGDHPIVDDPVVRDVPAIEVVPQYLRGSSAAYRFPYGDVMLKVTTEDDVEMALWEGLQEPGVHRPLITTRAHGKGRVVYIAANLGFQHNSHHTWPHIRRMLTNSVRYAAGDAPPPFVVAGPKQLQATMFRQEGRNRTILHLLNDPAPHGLPPFTKQQYGGYFRSFDRLHEDVVPLHEVPVRLWGTFSRVYTAPDRQELAMTVRDGYTQVMVPRVDVHLMVVGDEVIEGD